MRQENQLDQQGRRLDIVDRRLERMEACLRYLCAPLQPDGGVCAMREDIAHTATTIACEDITLEDTPEQQTLSFREEVVCCVCDPISLLANRNPVHFTCPARQK